MQISRTSEIEIRKALCHNHTVDDKLGTIRSGPVGGSIDLDSANVYNELELVTIIVPLPVNPQSSSSSSLHQIRRSDTTKRSLTVWVGW
jgi:hypothetical protein